MPNFSSFTEFFKQCDSEGRSPFPYQERLAGIEELPIVVNLITGVGKTSLVLLWLWRRRYASKAIQEKTPRRLVYCLPMRSLVEQTYTCVETWLKNAGLTEKVSLHMLMGGAVSNQWEADPEKDCILIGTQDQLLSRALNRGYSMSRYKWTIHFALLNNDCLWVMDETQLMGAGLRTTAQLQGFREKFQTYGSSRSLWMSATLDPDAIKTVDYHPDFSQTFTLTPEDKSHPVLRQRIEAKKRLMQAQTILQDKEEEYAKALAVEILNTHTAGTLTLAICNVVARAQAVYKALQKITDPDLRSSIYLVHSRFRGMERQEFSNLFTAIQKGEKTGILVATQAIEAGIDISARVEFTELAPWSSLIQRFGRCNRYGEAADHATVYWIDISDLKKNASPYEASELETAKLLLSPLTDVGSESLKLIDAPKQKLEGLIPRVHDLIQLFDTSTDLAGHDIDVSPFIRETDDQDVTMAWRSWEGDKPPNQSSDPHYKGALQPNELCRVNLYRAKGFMEKHKLRVWAWSGLQGDWVGVDTRSIYAGMSLLLHSAAGGYSKNLGFTGDVKDKLTETDVDIVKSAIAPDRDESDLLATKVSRFVTLNEHSQDVFNEVSLLCNDFANYSLETELLKRAGRWHDVGKAHPVFQEMLTHDRPDLRDTELWAKSDLNFNPNLKPSSSYRMPTDRRGFRHELVSALLAMQENEPFLLVYLVACHHGKVRMTIQPRPTEIPPKNKKVARYALGVHEGDEIAPFDLGDDVKLSASHKLSLACMELGDSKHGESWNAQAIALLDQYGAFKLAFMEALIRIADWRASEKYTSDILESIE